MLSDQDQGDPYKEIAELYDLEHDDFDQDLPMYLQFVEAAGDPVLELACGSGRVCVPLASAGWRVTGLDSSQAMLEAAAARGALSGVGGRLRLLAGLMDEEAPIPGGPYGVVILALDALLHLPTQEQQLATLRRCHRLLDPRGQLLVDILHATPDRLRAYDGSLIHAGPWFTRDGERIDKLSAHVVRPADQLIESQIFFDVTGRSLALRRISTSLRQRYISPGELVLMVQSAGFEDWRIYGDYELGPLEDHSDRVIIAADVTKTG